MAKPLPVRNPLATLAICSAIRSRASSQETGANCPEPLGPVRASGVKIRLGVVDMFGEMGAFFTDESPGIGMVRIPLDGRDPAIFDTGQQAAGIRAVFGTNRTFPHGGFSGLADN